MHLSAADFNGAAAIVWAYKVSNVCISFQLLAEIDGYTSYSEIYDVSFLSRLRLLKQLEIHRLMVYILAGLAIYISYSGFLQT